MQILLEKKTILVDSDAMVDRVKPQAFVADVAMFS